LPFDIPSAAWIKEPTFSWWDDGKGHTRENPCWIGDCAMEESPYARGACSWGHYVQDWQDLNRREVCQNAAILEPVIQHLGVLAMI